MVDVGYCLKYCGHRVIKGVKEYKIDDNKYWFTGENNELYCIPIENIEWIIPFNALSGNENIYGKI